MDVTKPNSSLPETDPAGGDVAARLDVFAAVDPSDAPVLAETLADDLTDALDRVGTPAATPQPTSAADPALVEGREQDDAAAT